MLIPAERQKKILNLIHQQGIVRITNLVELMGVSHMTIRRDIQKLEEKGKVVSVSGGVQLLERLISEPTRDDKSLLFHQQKSAIGLVAANLIPANATIYLDAGTTTLEIAKQITDRDDLLVITNDFGIVDYLISNGRCDLIHTGGECVKKIVLLWGIICPILRNISIDIAFISTSSWNLQGLTTPDENKLPVKRAIVQASRRNILVTDSSKYGKVATFLLYALDTLDQIICDKALLINAQEKIKEMDIELC